MVKQPEKRKLPVPQNDEECSQEVEEAREVESVGPEEDTTRGTHPKWEA